MAEAREPAAGDGMVARRQQGREWRALGATLVAPGVAGAWTLVTGRGRLSAAAVSLGWLVVGAILLALVPDQGEPVTLVVPGAWLAILLVAEGCTRAAAAWRRTHPARVAAPWSGRPDAPAWRSAATGALVFAGGFAVTAVVVAGVVH